MKRNKKLVVLVMVFALAFSGIAYAAWTDTLYINGTAATGNLNAEFVAANAANDNDPAAYDVATLTAQIGNLNEAASVDGDSGVNDLLTINIDNAYPGYVATIPYCIQNTGSIPAKLNAISILGASADLQIDGAALPVPQYIPVGGTVSGTLTVTVGDNAAEDADYSFDVQYDITQF